MAYDKVVDSAKLDADLTIVADAIREKTGGTDALEWPVDIVAGVDEVYEAGKTTIVRSMTSLNYLFVSNNNMDILPVVLTSDLSAVTTAQYTFIDNTQIEEFVLPETLRPRLIHGLFQRATRLTTVSGLEGLNTSVLTDLFNGCSALIDAGIVNFTSASYASRTFAGCIALQEIRIEGIIKISVSLEDCAQLSKASIMRVINALSGTTSALPVTLSLTAVNNAFETIKGASDGSTSEEWLTLVDTKPNWTISLS